MLREGCLMLFPWLSWHFEAFLLYTRSDKLVLFFLFQGACQLWQPYQCGLGCIERFQMLPTRYYIMHCFGWNYYSCLWVIWRCSLRFLEVAGAQRQFMTSNEGAWFSCMTSLLSFLEIVVGELKGVRVCLLTSLNWMFGNDRDCWRRASSGFHRWPARQQLPRVLMGVALRGSSPLWWVGLLRWCSLFFSFWNE